MQNEVASQYQNGCRESQAFSNFKCGPVSEWVGCTYEYVCMFWPRGSMKF